MELYHITKLEFLPNILTNGLLINSNNNGFVKKSFIKEYHKKYGMQPIFLTNDVDSVIKRDLGKELFLKQFIVLKIHADTLSLEDEYNYLYEKWYLFYNSKESMLNNLADYFGKRFICRQNIKPELIHIYNQ